MKHLDGNNLVFIAGCPRSGTTFIQRLLAALPNIQTGQESHLFEYVGPIWNNWQRHVKMKQNDGRGGVGLPCYFEEDAFLDHLCDFIECLLTPMLEMLEPGDIFVEKTPSNALYMDSIHKILPKAKFICIHRDARDVVASLMAAHHSWGKQWAPSTARKAALLWCQHINKSKNDSKNLPVSQIFQLKYEELQSHPAEMLSQLALFLDMKWSVEDIRKAVNENRLDVARTSGGTQIRTNLKSKKSNIIVHEPEGFVRRGKPGGWKKDLTLKDKFWVWRIARLTMKRVGYNWNFPYII
ncbi:MAG: sulfotransferase [Proteobacteria bacterium]|nr:sulfotransferase [Pseudomonadota bacterium]